MSDGVPHERLAVSPGSSIGPWREGMTYPKGTIGRIMDPPAGVFAPDLTVAQTIETLREMVKTFFITYGMVMDSSGKLLGILVMRDLLLARPDQLLSDIMLPQPFCLRPEMRTMDAMKAVLDRHYPVYPVCDAAGRLVGLVRGQALFRQEAIEISAQAGAMVGVEREEGIATPWTTSLKYRHPWLQLNLLTAFLAAGVVSLFAGTIERVSVLAAFLPVLIGQSANTGCQSLAVSLRAMVLGELKPGQHWPVVVKEAILGTANGALVGVVTAAGMILFAHLSHAPAPAKLAVAAFISMTLSCVSAGILGAMVPLVLRKMGFDPATASSIFLTTFTDVISTASLLGLTAMLMG